MNKKLLLTLALVVLALSATSAVADTIEFTASGVGSYTFPGTLGSVLTGTSTDLTARQVLPIPSAPIPVPGAVLNFTSGFATGFGLVDTFTSGGTISITGGSCLTPCFIGTFTAGQYDIGNSIFSGAWVAGDVSPAVWALVGLAPMPTGAWGGLTATLIPVAGSGGGRVGSVDFSLTRIPEPASLALLGSGLLLAAGMARRKLGL
jgi:hypothetical protein